MNKFIVITTIILVLAGVTAYLLFGRGSQPAQNNQTQGNISSQTPSQPEQNSSAGQMLPVAQPSTNQSPASNPKPPSSNQPPAGQTPNPQPLTTQPSVSQPPPPTQPPQQQNVTVVISNFAFNPQTITIKSGTTITWINQDSAPHIIASDPHPTHTDLPGLVSGTLMNGQSFSFKFTQTGTFGYHCHLHPFMTGTVIVEQ